MTITNGFALKWSVSRGRDTYGYPICTLVGDGLKAQCMGGGYDMEGTVLAGIMTQLFPEYFDGTVTYTPEDVKANYGLRVLADGSACFDGGCGVNCVERFIHNVIGATVTWEYHRDRKGRVTRKSGVEITHAARS